MMCRMGYKFNKKFQIGLSVLGLISLCIGLLLCFVLQNDGSCSIGLFSGMLTGLGAASLFFGIINLVKISHMKAEELQKLHDQADDERNKAINAEASRITVIIVGMSALITALAAALLGNVTVTFTLVGTIYVILLCFIITAGIIEKKM